MAVTNNWTGARLTLQPYDTAVMPQTTNGSMVLVYTNLTTQNNAGELSVTSGGGSPSFYPAPALVRQPLVLVNNWMANNLSLGNISGNPSTPILVQAYGPGLPGQNPLNLSLGNSVNLTILQSASGATSAGWTQLTVKSNTADVAVVAIVGGPVDGSQNNAKVVAINSPSGDTGPTTPNPAPTGYYATRQGNLYTFQCNWAGAVLYIANVSAANNAPVTVTMIGL